MTEEDKSIPVKVWPVAHGDLRITAPSGRVTYLGFWEGLHTVIGLIFAGYKIEVSE